MLIHHLILRQLLAVGFTVFRVPAGFPMAIVITAKLPAAYTKNLLKSPLFRTRHLRYLRATALILYARILLFYMSTETGNAEIPSTPMLLLQDIDTTMKRLACVPISCVNLRLNTYMYK
ncbi:hypothetical protein BD289DRAFT_441702 [Coniella lustricola]|uniref:Uncharacterized protein n=1 Tax=Coniella lustricola TaxID=2025994 RepID=A0A2T2ZZ43_9PEZI|nr:hypothetical protein BD289DRAFT_441702 [Coniella lustricola]